MITSILSNGQIDKIRDAGKIVSACHVALRDFIEPGLMTSQVDDFVRKFIVSHKAIPAQIGYLGYPFASCTSLNDEICHAFPGSEIIKEGDILKVDFVVNLKGWLADSCWCYAIGDVSPDADRLMKVTKECLYKGIAKSIHGNRIGDIGNVIQTHAEANGYNVVREYTGHGIGKEMHDGLIVPHYGSAGKGPRIREGMVFTIEPMINDGVTGCNISSDGWTARTVDGSLCAQYEHTIAITINGPEILTEQD